MGTKLFFALAFVVMAIALPAQTPRNIETYDQGLFASMLTDTLTDTVEVVAKWANYANWPMTYNWRLNLDKLTDTLVVAVAFQESPLTNPSTAYPSTDWYTRSTWTHTLAADKDTLVTLTSTYGRSVRVVLTTTQAGTMIFKPTFTIKRHISSRY